MTTFAGRALNEWGGMGVTLIDSLDTLLIMQLEEQYQRAKEYVANLEVDHRVCKASSPVLLCLKYPHAQRLA